MIPASTSESRREASTSLGMPILLNSANFVRPKNASRSSSRFHFCPRTVRLLATGQRRFAGNDIASMPSIILLTW